MDQKYIRNIAIIAHVDHGKTTLVDQLFRQSGMFRDNQSVKERLMDSMDLERERGITIVSKNGSFKYGDYWINIIDTPGHADFGGQVERVLKMADGALLLVDAQEGPMPQTYYVLKKALSELLPIVVVINKIDKPAARAGWVAEQVNDLFLTLNADDSILNFPIVYASAKLGIASDYIAVQGTSMEPLYQQIIKHIPPPKGDPDAPLQMLVSSIDYSTYLGRLGIGKITSGAMNINKAIAVVDRSGAIRPARVTKVYHFEGTEKKAVEIAGTGEIVAVAGMDEVTVGVTYTDPDNPLPLPPMEIDPPTLSINFIPNDSPFSGREGQFLTSGHLKERLFREALGDVALHIELLTDRVGFKVSGRGELHISIVIEKMRREGYEFQLMRPEVILHTENGETLEPYELLAIDVTEQYVGAVIERLGPRKGQLMKLEQENGLARLEYKIPTRGLMGFRSEFLTVTKGMGVMSYAFAEYGPHAGTIINRLNGVLCAMEACTVAAYALFNLQDRGVMFVNPGVPVYKGQIVGEHSRDNDLIVNPGRNKKMSNMRASGSDEAIVLSPPRLMSLEDCLTYINADELVEVTPKNIRLRKKSIDKVARRGAVQEED